MPDESTTPDLTACVLHAGRLDRDGYGRVGQCSLAHRTVWEAVHGLVLPGLEIHHVCENRACVNVDHLAAVTHKQHVALHLRTHCIHGHRLDAENTSARPDGGRRCLVCNRAKVARYRKRKALGCPKATERRAAA